MKRQQTGTLCIVVLLMWSVAGTAYAQDQLLPDADITHALEQQLYLDEAVAAHLIDVTVTDGIVTLSGSVDNILAKERATQIAEAIKGVRSVVNTIVVHPVMRPDDDIRQDIEQILRDDPATNPFDITVTVSEGTVTLAGTVDSWVERKLCEDDAKEVKGVSAVMDTITVNYPEQRPDSEIKADIERRLEIDPRVNELSIVVAVTDGMVTLSGQVGSAGEKTRALMDCWVEGTQAVNGDALKVVWWRTNKMIEEAVPAAWSDDQVVQAVHDAFSYDPRVSNFALDVTCEHGEVTLEGTVDNFRAKQNAGQDARNTRGVWHVINRIKVRPPVLIGDEILTRSVREALVADPYLERFSLTVMVRNSKVYLYGTVDSSYEKKRATDVASRVPGVVDVVSYITVHDIWKWKSDAAIEAAIKDELFWDFSIDETRITVRVENGTAHLTGSVDSWSQYNRVINKAFSGGANVVESELTVDGEPAVMPIVYYRDIYEGLV